MRQTTLFWVIGTLLASQTIQPLQAASGDRVNGFGANGVSDVQAQTGLSAVHSVEYSHNGSVLLAGPCNTQYCLARVNNTGVKEDSFGANGIISVDFSAQDNAVGVAGFHDLLNSYFYVANAATVNNQRLVIARTKLDGTLDTEFDTDGFARVTFPNIVSYTAEYAYPNYAGSPLIVGHAQLRNSDTVSHLFVAQLNRAGQSDATFYGSGRHYLQLTLDDTAHTAIEAEIDQVKVLKSGQIYLVGHSTSLGNEVGFVFRFQATGAMDGSFDDDGKMLFDYAADRVTHLSLDVGVNGLIAVAASTENDAGEHAVVLNVLEADGDFKTDFSTDGFTLLRPQSENFSHVKVKWLPDEQIVLTGNNAAGQLRFLRVERDGDIGAGGADIWTDAFAGALHDLSILHSGEWQAVSGTHAVRWQGDDRVPDAFVLGRKDDVNTSSTQYAAAVQVSGLTANALVSVVSGNATVAKKADGDCSSSSLTYSSNPIVIANAQYLCVRLISSAALDTERSSTIAVGSQAAEFVVKTRATAVDSGGGGGGSVVPSGLVLLFVLWRRRLKRQTH